jgi:hypothetical protein
LREYLQGGSADIDGVHIVTQFGQPQAMTTTTTGNIQSLATLQKGGMFQQPGTDLIPTGRTAPAIAFIPPPLRGRWLLGINARVSKNVRS